MHEVGIQSESLHLHMLSQVNINHNFKWEYHDDIEKTIELQKIFVIAAMKFKKRILCLNKIIVKTAQKSKPL